MKKSDNRKQKIEKKRIEKIIKHKKEKSYITNQ